MSPRFLAAGLLAATAALVSQSRPLPTDPDRAPLAQEREERDEKEPGFDAPNEALEWILLAHRDESGRIPRDGLQRAREQAEEKRRESREREEELQQLSPAAAGISRGQWTWVGPTNIGGRVRALAIHPTQTSTLLTGGVSGGIWKSDNGGSNWRLIDDFMGTLAVSSIAFYPADPNIVVAGTGEGFFNSDAIRGAGIFISTTLGENWAQLPSTATTDFDFVNRVAFSQNGSVLMAATRTGLFRSLNLGATWTMVLSQTSMLDVKFVPGSNTVAVAGGRNRNAYYSLNGGQTWTPAGGLAGAGSSRVELAVSRSSPSVVYASLDESSGQIWKSVDSGASYTKVGDSSHLSDQGWYDNALWVDPINVDHLIAGGVSLFRSTNGGANFSLISNCHADQHIIVSDPNYNGNSNRRVYFGSDGGVCKMEDVLVNSVTSLRNGLGITQFYGGGGNGGAGRILGGTQDNGTLIYNLATGTGAWTMQHGSDGGFAAVDPTDPNYLYGEIQNFRLHRSVTGGPPSQYIYGGTGAQSCTKPVPFQITDACSEGLANFIAPFVLDPNDPNRLLAGGRSLWRTNDARTPNTASTGPIWTAIKSPSANSNISAIAIAPGNPDVVWVGHNNGDLYVSFNGTSSEPGWLKVDAGLPNRMVTSIALDPSDASIVYASFGGFASDTLWRTTNNGATWLDVSGPAGVGLPDVPVRSVAIHPFLTSWIYAATDVGVFASEDGGNSWGVPHDGPANVAVFQLFWMDAALVAVTHGRGMYSFVTASQRPAFAKRPLSQPVLPGQSVAFNAVAVGVQPITFQWYRGISGDTSNPIPGATSGSYVTPPVSTTTNYWVRIANALGTTDSTTATLSVLPWATLYPGVKAQGSGSIIGTEPRSQSVRSGSTATFAVVSLVPSVTYQWQVSSNGRNWQNLADGTAYRGARSSALVVTAGRGYEGWRFRCIVSAGSVSQVSAAASLTVRR